jgi:hypothetical protein
MQSTYTCEDKIIQGRGSDFVNEARMLHQIGENETNTADKKIRKHP